MRPVNLGLEGEVLLAELLLIADPTQIRAADRSAPADAPTCVASRSPASPGGTTTNVSTSSRRDRSNGLAHL